MSEPTYRDVAEWLPTDIREHIEATLPCPIHGAHDWRHERTDISMAGYLAPVRTIEHWQCRGCGLIHTADPETRR